MSKIRYFRAGLSFAAFATVATILIAPSASARDARDEFPSYTIMAPEPGTRPQTRPRPRAVEEPRAEPQARPAPPRRARGSSSSPSVLPRYESTVRPLGVAPRSIDPPGLTAAPAVPTPVPGYATVPAPPTSLSGQSFQDRAAGCVHYGTSQGIGAGQIGAYTGSCINSR